MTRLGAGRRDQGARQLDDQPAAGWSTRLADLGVARASRTSSRSLPLGGTDAGAIQRSRGGVASVTLSNPSRYVHTVVEMLAKRDLEAAVALLTAFLSTPGAAVAPRLTGGAACASPTSSTRIAPTPPPCAPRRGTCWSRRPPAPPAPTGPPRSTRCSTAGASTRSTRGCAATGDALAARRRRRRPAPGAAAPPAQDPRRRPQLRRARRRPRRERPDEPATFMKPATTIVGPDEEVLIPPQSRSHDRRGRARPDPRHARPLPDESERAGRRRRRHDRSST